VAEDGTGHETNKEEELGTMRETIVQNPLVLKELLWK
jgi:hypothetical protein